MSNGFVAVLNPARRRIFVGGNRNRARAPLSPCLIEVAYGPNTFETLRVDGSVDYSLTVKVTTENPILEIKLDWVL